VLVVAVVARKYLPWVSGKVDDTGSEVENAAAAAAVIVAGRAIKVDVMVSGMEIDEVIIISVDDGAAAVAAAGSSKAAKFSVFVESRC